MRTLALAAAAAVAVGAEGGRRACSSADLAGRTDDLNAACCAEPTACSQGRPSTCDAECARLLLPFFAECGTLLGEAASGYQGVVALCQTALPDHAGQESGCGETRCGKCPMQVRAGMACAGTGEYYRDKGRTEEECCEMCAADRRCAEWTFHGSKAEGKCILASGSQPPKVKQGCTCGVKDGPAPPPTPPTPPAPPAPTPPAPPGPLPPGPHAPFGPDPSLETIPVICHSFDGKHSAEQWPRDPAEIATLAKFRMVVIEKFEGTCWDQCYVHPVPGKCVPACDVERYMLGTAQALKAANPKLSVLM